MASAAVFFGLVFGLFALFDLAVVLLRGTGRVEATRWPRQIFSWFSVLLGLALAVLFFIRASLS